MNTCKFCGSEGRIIHFFDTDTYIGICQVCWYSPLIASPTQEEAIESWNNEEFHCKMDIREALTYKIRPLFLQNPNKETIFLLLKEGLNELEIRRYLDLSKEKYLQIRGYKNDLPTIAVS